MECLSKSLSRNWNPTETQRKPKQKLEEDIIINILCWSLTSDFCMNTVMCSLLTITNWQRHTTQKEAETKEQRVIQLKVFYLKDFCNAYTSIDNKLDPLQTSDLLSGLRGNHKHIREHKQINQSKK